MLARTFFPPIFRNGPRAWDAFRDLRHIQEEMNHLFDQTWSPWSAEYPPLNVWNSPEDVVVQAELPGFAPDDVEISVEQNTLTLRGTRKPEELKEGETYHRRERWTGNFVRTLELPFEVAADKVEAEFGNGVL